MAKIIVSMGDDIIQELILSKERTTIGRRPHNDIVIESLAISGEHAVIVTMVNDSFLEDLNSTNGTLVNGQPVKKHFLQNNDVIELAKYKIRFVAGQHTAKTPDVLVDNFSESASKPQAGKKQAKIRVLTGPSADKEMVLTKDQTTLGRPGVHVAVISNRALGYFITHVEGDNFPQVNGVQIDKDAYMLSAGDVIDLSGTKMEFSFV